MRRLLLAALAAFLAAAMPLAARAQAPVWLSSPTGTPLGTTANPLPVTVSGGSGTPTATTPHAGTASAIVTGGTALVLVTGPVNGCYITNPTTAADQNIATAETLYVNPVATATANGRGTNSALAPGQPWNCPPGMTTNVSAIAATTAHAASVVVW